MQTIRKVQLEMPAKAAQEYLGNIEEFPEARVLSTPFALELARFGSQDEAIEEQRRLSKGEYVSTYILRTGCQIGME